MDHLVNHPRLSNDIATVLSAPWLINRVTCGTIVTWSQDDSQDVVVSLDLCLLGLITANVLLFGPLLLRRAGLSQELDGVVGGVGGMVGVLQERLDLLPGPPTLPWERWSNGVGGVNPDDLENNSGTNITFLEGALASFMDSVPLQTSLKLANHLRQIFERSDTSDDFEEEDEDEEEDLSSDQNLNIQRLPVFVYKFPVDKHSGFGDGYEGMETEVGEVLDLSLATDPERTTYLRLPRKEVVASTLPELAGHLVGEMVGGEGDMVDEVVDVVDKVLKMEKVVEVADDVVELLVATLGKALTVEENVPR